MLDSLLSAPAQFYLILFLPLRTSAGIIHFYFATKASLVNNMPKSGQKSKNMSSFLTANSKSANLKCTPSSLAASVTADFQAAIDKLGYENLELLVNFQKECRAAITALQQVVDEHGRTIQDMEQLL